MTESSGMEERLAALEADNVRLRGLLDQAGIPDSLRHGLRNTLAMLRTIMRRSAENAQDVDSYVAHLEGRLSAITRVQTTTDTFGEADLHTLISDELTVHLVREGERATLRGPRVRFRPKAAMALALAVHELTSNAIEHGSLALPQGRVTASWQIGSSDPDPVFTLTWKETGGSGVLQPARRGFGTVLLEDMLAYELEARSVLTYEPDGLRCTLLFPLATQLGRLIDTEETHDADDDGD